MYYYYLVTVFVSITAKCAELVEEVHVEFVIAYFSTWDGAKVTIFTGLFLSFIQLLKIEQKIDALHKKGTCDVCDQKDNCSFN